MANVRRIIGDKITYVDDMYEAVDGADALLIFTEWNEFKQANLDKVKKTLNAPLVIDGRNLYQPQEMKDRGFTYISTGRNAV